MDMWLILEKKTVTHTLKRAPHSVLVRYEAWKRIVELEGPHGLRLIKGFHDEALKGQWQGFHSSRLGLKWRVIYAVRREHLEVYVVEVNPHEY
jgi:mRNA-degrading endonuclease YafQ of YafQ-DinJ toxin-antitoxin module